MEIHRLFDSFDKGTSFESHQGIKSLDVSKMNPFRAFFAKLFGVTVEFGGKTYVIGKESAAQFIERNSDARVNHKDGEAIKKALINLYNNKIHEKGKQLTATSDKIEMTPADLKLVLKAVGLSDKQLMVDLGLKSTVEKAEKVKPQALTLSKEQLINAIKKHKDELKSDEFKDIVTWLKDEIGKASSADLPELKAPTKEEVYKELKDKKKVEDRLKLLMLDLPAQKEIRKEALNDKEQAQALLDKLVPGQKEQANFLKNWNGIARSFKQEEKEFIESLFAKAGKTI